ncbi:MAG: DinB family protein [Anaerolineaceae bacterium]|nr:MAG: DinB family protein [Anaerolineaceae bacterium]
MKPSEMFSHWKRVRNGLFYTIDLFNDDELHYIPEGTSWPVGRTMLHIADTEDGWFRYAVKKELEEWPSQYILENYPTRVAIKEVLTEVHERTEEFIDALEESDLTRIINAPWGEEFPLGWIFWHVLEHEIHHRGELSLILGLLGREGLDV